MRASELDIRKMYMIYFPYRIRFYLLRKLTNEQRFARRLIIYLKYFYVTLQLDIAYKFHIVDRSVRL